MSAVRFTRSSGTLNGANWRTFNVWHEHADEAERRLKEDPVITALEFRGKAYPLNLGGLIELQNLLRRDEHSIDMVLHCPACHKQHIDAPTDLHDIEGGDDIRGRSPWTNPPHRSHLCAHCGFIWRPADVPTNGVAAVKTKGRSDS